MKRLTLFSLIFILFPALLLAQPAVKVKAAATIMCNAAVDGHNDVLANYIYPKMLEQMGGKDSFISICDQAAKKLAEENIKLIKAEIDEPGNIIKIGNRMFCLLQQTIYLLRDNKTYKSTSSLVAVSDNGGEKWYFISANDSDNQPLYYIFPELKGKINIPESGHPVLVTGNN